MGAVTALIDNCYDQMSHALEDLKGQHKIYQNESLKEGVNEYFINKVRACLVMMILSSQMGTVVFQKRQEQKLDRKSASHCEV